MENTIAIIFGSLSIVGSLFYLHNQNRAERIVSDNRWAELLREFRDYKDYSKDEFRSLKTNKQDRESAQ